MSLQPPPPALIEGLRLLSKSVNAYGTTLETVRIHASQVPPYRPPPTQQPPCAYCLTTAATGGNCPNCGAPRTVQTPKERK